MNTLEPSAEKSVMCCLHEGLGYQRKANRPHVNSFKIDCALIVSKGLVSVAAAATPTTNDMQHIAATSRTSPTLLCGQQYAQSNFTLWMFSVPFGAVLREERKKKGGGTRWRSDMSCDSLQGKENWTLNEQVFGRTRGRAERKYRPSEVRQEEGWEWGPGVEKEAMVWRRRWEGLKKVTGALFSQSFALDCESGFGLQQEKTENIAGRRVFSLFFLSFHFRF